MSVPSEILELVHDELKHVSDARVVAHINELIVSPYCVDRHWDYGDEGQKFSCWTVLEHPSSHTAIAYCEEGFGPTFPWGLVQIESENSTMGMDSAWFPIFMDAYFESPAAGELPIWRVSEARLDGSLASVSGEMTLDKAWEQTRHLNQTEPDSRFRCTLGVTYRRHEFS